jgi:hypothetical protein
MLKLVSSRDPLPWWLTMVYGPHREFEKDSFFARSPRNSLGLHWVVVLCRDFNLIYKAEFKNNIHLNCHLMGVFRQFLQDLELSKLHLNG